MDDAREVTIDMTFDKVSSAHMVTHDSETDIESVERNTAVARTEMMLIGKGESEQEIEVAVITTEELRHIFNDTKSW